MSGETLQREAVSLEDLVQQFGTEVYNDAFTDPVRAAGSSYETPPMHVRASADELDTALQETYAGALLEGSVLYMLKTIDEQKPLSDHERNYNGLVIDLFGFIDAPSSHVQNAAEDILQQVVRYKNVDPQDHRGINTRNQIARLYRHLHDAYPGNQEVLRHAIATRVQDSYARYLMLPEDQEYDRDRIASEQELDLYGEIAKGLGIEQIEVNVPAAAIKEKQIDVDQEYIDSILAEEQNEAVVIQLDQHRQSRGGRAKRFTGVAVSVAAVATTFAHPAAAAELSQVTSASSENVLLQTSGEVAAAMQTPMSGVAKDGESLSASISFGHVTVSAETTTDSAASNFAAPAEAARIPEQAEAPAIEQTTTYLSTSEAAAATIAVSGYAQGAHKNHHGHTANHNSKHGHEAGGHGRYEPLLKLVSRAEGGDNYNAYYGHGDNTHIKFTDMSVGEVMAWQRHYVANGSASSAVGRYQFLVTTLESLTNQHDVPLHAKFDKHLQDKLAVHLLEKRGLRGYEDGKISDHEFAHNLSMEWASLPKVTGSHPQASYYAGDGLNHSFIDVHEIVHAVRAVKHHGEGPSHHADTGNVHQAIVHAAVAAYHAWPNNATDNGNTNPRIDKYTQGRNEAWCADFATNRLKAAGVPIDNIPLVSNLYNTMVQRGDFTVILKHKLHKGEHAQPGDVVFYNMHGNLSALQNAGKGNHVGIVREVDQHGNIVSIDGNWDDQVNEHDTSIHDVTLMAVGRYTGGGGGHSGGSSDHGHGNGHHGNNGGGSVDVPSTTVIPGVSDPSSTDFHDPGNGNQGNNDHGDHSNNGGGHDNNGNGGNGHGENSGSTDNSGSQGGGDTSQPQDQGGGFTTDYGNGNDQGGGNGNNDQSNADNSGDNGNGNQGNHDHGDHSNNGGGHDNNGNGNDQGGGNDGNNGNAGGNGNGGGHDEWQPSDGGQEGAGVVIQ